MRQSRYVRPGLSVPNRAFELLVVQ